MYVDDYRNLVNDEETWLPLNLPWNARTIGQGESQKVIIRVINEIHGRFVILDQLDKVTVQKRFSFLRWCWLVRWRMNRSDKNTWYFKKDVPLCDPFCRCVIIEGKKTAGLPWCLATWIPFPLLYPWIILVIQESKMVLSANATTRGHTYSSLIIDLSLIDSWTTVHVYLFHCSGVFHFPSITCVYLVVLWETWRCPGKIIILVKPKLVSCFEKFKIQIQFLIELNKILIQ